MEYNALDYVKWRGDLSFETAPINDVDELLFACIGKPNYSHIFPERGELIPLKDVVEKYLYLHKGQKKVNTLGSSQLLELLKLMAESERYGSLLLSDFVSILRPDEIEQFSALTVHVPGGRFYVTFRGTDDTLLGWQENCGLAILSSIPAQRSAAAYLEAQADKFGGEIVVNGHSKGGNLSIYSACSVSEKVRSRIGRVISYDGPGFLPEFFDDPGYAQMKERIHTYLPYHSIVGMIFSEAGIPHVVSSDEFGVDSHDPLLWHIDRNGFVEVPELSRFSRVFNTALDTTFNQLELSERQELVDEIFDILYSTGAFQLADFSSNTLSQMLEMAGHFRKAPVLRSFLYTLSELYLKGSVRSQFTKKEDREYDTANL